MPDNIANYLITKLSLIDLDKAWQDTLAESTLVKWLGAAGRFLTFGYINESLGTGLQTLSFYLVVALFACLAMPNFANEKEGLALMAFAAALLWLVGKLIGGRQKRSPTAVDLLVIAYGCLNIISAASSHYFVESLKGLSKVFVYLISYFLFTAQFSDNKNRQLKVLGSLIVTATLVALYGLYQYKIGVAPLATWEDPNIEHPVTRIYATLNNPNLLAGYLVPIVPLAASLALAAFSQRKWFVGLAPTLATLLLIVAIVLTGSRGGYLGLLAEALAFAGIFSIYLWNSRPKLRPLLLSLIVIVPLALFLALHNLPAFEQRVASIFAGREHSSNSFRLNVWLSSLRMLKDNWWFGIGVGNQAFCQAYGLYMRSGFDALGTYCVPLEVAVETGVIGAIIFTLLVLAVLSRGHLNFARHGIQGDWQSYLMAGASAALIGLMFHGLVDTVFYRPQVQFIFWLLIALLVSKSIDGGSSK